MQYRAKVLQTPILGLKIIRPQLSSSTNLSDTIMPYTSATSESNQPWPTIAIIGGGPAGLVLLLRGVPATLYEREPDRDSRGRSLPRDPAEAKKALLDMFEGWAPWMRKFI
ncbi:hypothetical protein BV20DRAFT_961033 [Pilatotrama ljubarskyi]|nr:hypothetical protein BV20DRAFT_961033 [Pilatotrama ljubarskyi]